MKLSIFLFLLANLIPGLFLAQNLLDHLELNVGYASQHQDRRLFDFNFKEAVVRNEDVFYDHQYDINLNATLLNKSIFTISAGAGYSMFVSKFSRPYDATYFGDYSFVAHYADSYTLHNLSFINTYKIKLNSDENNALSFILPLRADFTFDKHMTTLHRDENFNQFLFEFNKVEIYMGLHGKLHRFTASLLYRVFNYQLIDPVIFNRILFDEPHPSFLEKKYESINFAKVMLNAGYIF